MVALLIQNNESPKKHVDKYVQKFKTVWKKLNVEYDYFIRTTDEYHKKASIYIWNLLKKNNYIKDDQVDEFEFNQDLEFDSEIQSPGWKRYQKKLKSNR